MGDRLWLEDVMFARCVNVTSPSKVRCRSTRSTWSLSRALVVGNVGGNVMWMQHAQYTGFHVLGSGPRFFIMESAAITSNSQTYW
jgi:hypothetical protein